jgi:hypothetical protein
MGEGKGGQGEGGRNDPNIVSTYDKKKELVLKCTYT